MANEFKRNSALCLMLAALFAWGFMFAKHDPVLRTVIPFGDDPYDAVGSFAIFVALLVAIIAVVRAFRRYPASPSATQQLYLIRAQMAVVLVVLITVGTDVVAMTRHPNMWIHSPAVAKLIVLLAGVTLAAVVVQRLLIDAKHGPRWPPPRWPTVATTVAVASAVLAFYPERLIAGVWTHLLTVVISAVILFATTRALLLALLPDITVDAADALPARGPRFGRASRWGIVALIGAGFGAFALLGELSEGSRTEPLARVLALVGVFLGLAIAGVVVAFAFLAAPLGLGSRR